MSIPHYPPPPHPQLQSALVRLPTEIKHIIFRYCFTANEPLTDPLVGCTRPGAKPTTQLGTNVLSTCRVIHQVADRRPLMTENIFRFTTVDRARAFFRSIGTENSEYVREVEVDAKKLDANHAGIGLEWLQYFAWGEGILAKTLGSIHADAPRFVTLRLNFESWPSIPMSRPELWDFLRHMLGFVEGLGRVVVVGASQAGCMALCDPWSPVHFVGGGVAGAHDLVDRMWSAVKPGDAGKCIRWGRRSGKLYLEVVSGEYLSKTEPNWKGPCLRHNCGDPWPENGSCTWSAYMDRISPVANPVDRDINPNAAE